MNDATLQGRNPIDPRELSIPASLKKGILKQSFPTQPLPAERLQKIADSLTNDETLVDDTRSELSPAEMVEHKLFRNLQGNPMPARFLLNKRGRYVPK
jgi:hypothetical protein